MYVLQLPASVKKIYDEYLSPTSPNTVNIDDRVKKSIESRMATPPLNIFSEAFEQVRIVRWHLFCCCYVV